MAEHELWDLIDSTGRPLGATVEKGAPHPRGTYHLVIGVWVIAPAGNFVTRRLMCLCVCVQSDR